MQRLLINKFNGGISNDPSLGIAGSVYDIQGLEIRKDSRKVTLKAGYATETEMNPTASGFGVIASIFEDETSNLVAEQNGKIYNYNSPGTVVHDALESILNMFVYTSVNSMGVTTNYGVVITSSKVLRWNYSFIDSNLGAGTAPGITTAVTKNFTGNDAVVYPWLNSFLVGNGEYITKVDTTTTSWSASDPLQIDRGYTIKGISRIGDQFYIYASNGSSTKQYLWDGISTEVSRSITWYDKPCQRIINMNNIDYMIVRNSNRRSLYAVNGYDPILVAQSDFIANKSDKFYFNSPYPNSFETINNIILIPGRYNFIWSFGNLQPNFPKVITKEFIYEGEEVTNMYYCDSTGYLYIFYYSNKSGSFKKYGLKIYLKDSSPTANKYNVNAGTLITNPIRGETYSDNKKTVKCRVGYKMNSGNKINIYAKPDEGEKYTNIYCDSVTTVPTAGATYTASGVTYTVVSTTQVGGNSYIIHCTYPSSSTFYSGTLTKASGTGDSTLTAKQSLNGFKLIQTITDNTKNRKTFTNIMYWNEIQFAFDLMTSDPTKTPELRDFAITYDIIQDDI